MTNFSSVFFFSLSTGLIFDVTGSYTKVFFFLGEINAGVSVLFLAYILTWLCINE